jgi:aspartyl-tRNA synthetase
MQRILSSQIANEAGKTAMISGWVHSRRDHGKLIFIDLRDRDGLVQVVILPSEKEAYEVGEKLRPEWVIEIEGEVNRRPENMVNSHIPSGTVEILAKKITVLNESKTPPFEIDKDTISINEELRLKYRYLDLRSERMHRNLLLRHKTVKFIRDYLDNENFCEIETPILTKSTPEGARDFIVPSRIQSGKFYALPQSPQQYKQLLMVGGAEKYFQIARCFRDEDQRGDRQAEFTQMDMEMSFVNEEDIISLNEKMIIEMIAKVAPEKKIQQAPFPRLAYKEVMEKYGTDAPDLRENKEDPNLLAFCWVIDFPFFEKTREGGWTFTHNPFSAPKPEHMANLINKEGIESIIAAQYDIVLNGFEIGGGSIRNHQPESLRSVFEIMGFSEDRIKTNFGHMLEAFSFGAPPHGGIAWGIDRVLAILTNEPNIREVIPFPKTGDARDPMMDSPSEVEEKQLKEANIQIKKS